MATAVIVGLIVCGLGFCILIYFFCKMVKSSSHMPIPGHFLLHPRTGTRFTEEQAIALQRRLDRIRRASSQAQHSNHQTPVPHTSVEILPGTPPPWDMEPPPPYETVIKTTTSLNQL